MQPEELIRYWVTTAEDDWTSTRKAFTQRDYVKALFWGHLYLEKLLKALVVQHTRKHAPYGHTLQVLAKDAGLALGREQTLLLERVTRYNIQARYPDYKFELKQLATRQFCASEIREVEDFGKWLKSMLKP